MTSRKELMEFVHSFACAEEDANWEEMQEETFSFRPRVKDLYHGNFEISRAELGQGPDPKLHIFMSSTFTDTAQERNFLMAKVWPQIRSFCLDRDVQFEVMDMRWGIRDQSTDDQQTVNICMAEIARCQEDCIGPNFIFLSTDKYGWRPPPYSLEVTLFLQLFSHVSSTRKKLLDTWYQRNDNTNPATYVIQPISKHASYQWWLNQCQLLKAFESGAEAIDMSWNQFSVTELEVVRGLIKPADRNLRALCYIRRYERHNLEQRVLADKKGYCNVDTDDNAINYK
eukprot:gene15832-18777_t